jgi:hypothetical protein
MCSQEDKENSGYENFDTANVAVCLLMLFYGSGKEGRPQELFKFLESANILPSTSANIEINIIIG